MPNEVTTQQQREVQTLLAGNMKAIKNVLPKHLTPERALRIAYTAIVKNPNLAQCTQISLMNTVIEASMLGLEIGGPLGMAHLVPFKNNKTGKKEATLIIGYKGYMDLAYRSDRIVNFAFHPVYEKDDFNYSYGLKPNLYHIPCEDAEPGPLKYAYAVVNFKNGGSDFEVVNKNIADKTKNRSAAKNKSDSPWNTEDEWTMWCKTAVRRLAKRIPLSPELQRAAMIDELADAGIDQGINHVIDIDFTEPGSNEDLKNKITREKEEPEKTPPPILTPNGMKKITDAALATDGTLTEKDIQKIIDWHLNTPAGEVDDLINNFPDVLNLYITAKQGGR